MELEDWSCHKQEEVPDVVPLYEHPIHGKNVAIPKEKDVSYHQICGADLFLFRASYHSHLQWPQSYFLNSIFTHEAIVTSV